MVHWNTILITFKASIDWHLRLARTHKLADTPPPATRNSQPATPATREFDSAKEKFRLVPFVFGCASQNHDFWGPPTQRIVIDLSRALETQCWPISLNCFACVHFFHKTNGQRKYYNIRFLFFFVLRRAWDPSKKLDLAICYKSHQSRALYDLIWPTWWKKKDANLHQKKLTYTRLDAQESILIDFSLVFQCFWAATAAGTIRHRSGTDPAQIRHRIGHCAPDPPGDDSGALFSTWRTL